MFTHTARARCPDVCPLVATLVSLTALLMNLQLAHPNPPSTFPTHVIWCIYASMSGLPVPTHTNDALRHPTARMKHQPSPPALLDGTGLLQMPLQRAQSPETMQDNRSNWDHVRHTRSHRRQHEPNGTPRHSATHTHLRGSSNAPLTALDPPISQPQASATIGVHFRPKPEGTILRHNPWEPKAQSLGTQGTILGYRRHNPWVPKVYLRYPSEMVRTSCPRCSHASASGPNDERIKRQRVRLVQSEAMR